MALSYKDVAEIIKLIDASDCQELIVELDDMRLVVRRRGADGQAEADYSDSEKAAAGTAAAFETGGSETTPVARRAEGAGEAAAHSNGLVTIRAPMVGTFYRAPSPQDPPFVEVGDRVEPGDPVCMIEVMKLFTTIEAQEAGRIVEIAVENATAVEYDQALFVIEPA
ncbi:MAG: acetyl-CoA carboxylase biotin carboxyl carrier protein [Kiloniellales bacterium]